MNIKEKIIKDYNKIVLKMSQNQKDISRKITHQDSITND